MSIEKDTLFWDRTAEKYSRSAISDQAGYQRTLKRTSEFLTADHRVLELGCGTGTTAFSLAGKVESYLATDISSEMIAIAREKQKLEPQQSLRFAAGTAESISDAGSFDAVLCFNYLHLVRDIRGTLCRIHSLLAPGGVFVSKTPCVGDMNVLIRFALPMMRAVGKAPYACVFKASDLQNWIEQAGFAVVAVENHGAQRGEARPYIAAKKITLS